MSPSSLIFVAVVAIWAAYLVIDTTRRREYLATARTVDRFSSSMRVLQRRAVRRESAEAFEASTAPMRSTSSVALHRSPQTAAQAIVEARAARAVPPVATVSNVAPASSATQVSDGESARPAARLRAAAHVRRARLLAVGAVALLSATLVTAVVAGLGLVSWFVPASTGLLGALLVVVMRRQAVLGRRARTTRTARRGAEAPATVRPLRPTQAETETEAAQSSPAREETPAARAMPVAQEFVPFDYAREVEPRIAADRELVAGDDVAAEAHDPLLGQEGWAPVPVPPPTYTLKARAEHPLPPPLEVEDDLPEYVEDEWYAHGYGQDTYGRASGQ